MVVLRRVALLAWTTITLAACASMASMMYPGLTEIQARQGQTEEKYDAFRDERTWLLRPMHVYGDVMGARIARNGRDLQIGATAILDGPGHPEHPGRTSLFLVFHSTSPSWWFLRSDLTVDFILGHSDRLSLGRAMHDGEVHSGYVSETMAVSVTLEQLRQLAEAEHVAGQLANVQFELSALHLERIRTFVDALPEVFGAKPRRAPVGQSQLNTR